jgi:hypothetical protein
VGAVRVHCYGCAATVRVDERAAAQGLAEFGWALDGGATYCAACSRPSPPELHEQLQPAAPGRELSRPRRIVLILGAVASALVALASVAFFYRVLHSIARHTSALGAGPVMIAAVAASACVYLPRWTWRAGGRLAHWGLPERRPGSGLAATGLATWPAAPWPLIDVPIAYGAALAAVIALRELTRGPNRPSLLVLVALIDLIFVALALGLARRTGPPQAWRFGLRRTPLRPAVGAVIAAYAAVNLASTVYLVLCGPFTPSGSDLFRGSEPLGVIVAIVVLAPFAEEFFFRGFLYATLRRSRSWPVATLLTSMLFAGAHLAAGYPLWALAPVAIFGVGACVVYERTGSLWPGIALHALFNAATFASPTVAGLTLVALLIAAAQLTRRPPGREPSVPAAPRERLDCGAAPRRVLR